jgi:AcrR family transcriptional regulator
VHLHHGGGSPLAPQQPPAATRRRGAALEDAILGAAWDVLAERGYAGFTYEAVAAAAGTSRPVLSRRWPRREDLVLAAIARSWAAQPVAVPDTGRLRDDAIGLLRAAAAGRTRLTTLLSVQLADFFRDTGTSLDQLRASLRPPGQDSPLETIVARAVARGELPDVPRSRRVLDLPFDLLRHDILMTMRPVPDEAIRELVDEVWLPLLRMPGDPAHP